MSFQSCIFFLLLGMPIFPLSLLQAQSDHAVDSRPNRVISRHDGSKDDIEAIGNRKIGRSRLGNWYSEEEEFALGRKYSQAILRTVKLIEDPQITEYVSRVGQTIVHNSDAKVAFTINVIDDDEINAFALPGGFLYVNSGLVLAAQDEAEMAAAMAHEIAHVAARHATRQMTRCEMFQLALIPLIVFWGGVGAVAQQTADLTTPIALAKFSRGFEAEADYLGVQYLYKTGYDPHAFITFFERIQAEEMRKPGFFSRAFADHPQTSTRMRRTQLEITKLFPVRNAYILSTSDFADVRSRLQQMNVKHRFDRRTNQSCSEDSPSCKEENRPTLKRRSEAPSAEDVRNSR